MSYLNSIQTKLASFGKLIFSKNKRDIAIGLSIGHENIIAVEVEIKQNEYKILRLASRKVESNEQKKALLIQEMFAEAHFESAIINTSLSGNTVIIRFIKFPYMNKKDLRQSLEFESEKYIPFNIADVIVDFDIVQERKEESKKYYNLALVAAKKDAVLGLHQICRDAHIELHAIGLDSFACSNLFEISEPDISQETVALVNIGSDVTNITIRHDGHPGFTRDILFGGTDITKKIAATMKFSQEKALEFKLNIDTTILENKIILKDSLMYLINELNLSFDFFKNQTSDKANVQKIYLFGGSSHLHGLQNILSEELSLPTFVFDPIKRFSIGESVDIKLIEQLSGSLSVPLGLAIRR